MTSTIKVSMNVEVMGCPTVCQHCWATGRHYQAMPLEDVSWVLHEVRRFCDAHELAYSGYPMHEVVAHPQAAQVLRLFHEIWQVEFQPLPTTGFPWRSDQTGAKFSKPCVSLTSPCSGLPSMEPTRSMIEP